MRIVTKVNSVNTMSWFLNKSCMEIVVLCTIFGFYSFHNIVFVLHKRPKKLMKV